MGSVSIDIYKKEKEYRHLTLSDENVVRYLIEKRSELDVSYGVNADANIAYAGDINGFNVELIVLYCSLDNLLQKIKIKERERELLEQLFKGYRMGDIISNGFPRQSAYRIFNGIIKKIVQQNKLDWESTIRKHYLTEEVTRSDE